jgi:serine O-acetyltransferase
MAKANNIAIVCATEASLWGELRARAEQISTAEPALASLLNRYVLARKNFADGIVHRLVDRLSLNGKDSEVVVQALAQALQADPEIISQMRMDIKAILERDPATEHALVPFLWYKGFHAISLHRISHYLWKSGRKDLAILFAVFNVRTSCG